MKKLLRYLIVLVISLAVLPLINHTYANTCMNVQVDFPPTANAPQSPVVVACHGGQDANIQGAICRGSEAEINPGGSVTLTNCDCLFAKENGQGCTFVQDQPAECRLDVSNFCAGGNAAGLTRGTVIGSCQPSTPVVVTQEVTQEVTAPPINQGPSCQDTCEVPCTESGTSGFMYCKGEAGADRMCIENSACGIQSCTACVPNIPPPPIPPAPGQNPSFPGQPSPFVSFGPSGFPQPTVPVGAVCQYEAACVPGMTPNVPAPSGIPQPPNFPPPGLIIPTPEFPFETIQPPFPTDFPPGFLTPTGFPPGFLTPTPGRGTPSVTPPRPSPTPTPSIQCKCAGLEVSGFFPGQPALVKAYAKALGANAASGRPKPIVFHFGIGDAANANNVTELQTSAPQPVQIDPTDKTRYFAVWTGFAVPKTVDTTRIYRVWATVANTCEIIAPLKNGVLAAETQDTSSQGGFIQAIINFFRRAFGGNDVTPQDSSGVISKPAPTKKADNNIQINTFQAAKVVKNAGCDGIYFQFPTQTLQ